MSEMEIDIMDPIKFEITNLNRAVEYEPKLWYNYRIGMKEKKDDDYINDYIPIFSLVKYDENMSKTKDIMGFFKSITPPEIKDPNSYVRRFAEIVFEKDPATNKILISTMDVEPKYGNYINADIKLSEIQKMNVNSIITLQEFVIEIIKESNLLGTILNTISNENKIVVLIDFYYNRSGVIEFHKDRYDYDTKYVSLTYDNDANMFGPDVISYHTNPEYRAKKETELEVFRPLLPSYSRIGFNDEILSHSSPYDKLPEMVEVCKLTEDNASHQPNMCQTMRLKASPYRIGNTADYTKRTFIRCWFQEAPASPLDPLSTIIKQDKLSIEDFTRNLLPDSNIGQINIYYDDKTNITETFLKNIIIHMNENLVNFGGTKRKKKNTRKMKTKSKKQNKRRNLKRTLKHKKRH